MKIFNPITDIEIKQLQKARQIFADCYLTSSINSFTRTESGRRVLRQNIQKAVTDGVPEYKIHFADINSKPEDVFVNEREIDKLVLTDKYCNIVEHNLEENPFQKAVEIAMNKLIRKNSSLKSFICRLADSVEDFEFNSPSKFMQMFTGKKPVTINENTLRMTLKGQKKDVFNLFEQMEADKEHHFVAGSGFKLFSPIKDCHCLAIQNVDLKQNRITLYDTREGKSIELTAKDFLDKIKFITGYFAKDLEKAAN